MAHDIDVVAAKYEKRMNALGFKLSGTCDFHVDTAAALVWVWDAEGAFLRNNRVRYPHRWVADPGLSWVEITSGAATSFEDPVSAAVWLKVGGHCG